MNRFSGWQNRLTAAAVVLLLPACETTPAPTAGGPAPGDPGQAQAFDPLTLPAVFGPHRAQHPVTTAPAPARDDSASGSADGRWLAYVSDANGRNFDVYVKRLDGVAVTRVTDDPHDDLYPRISPDGKRIAFCSNRNGNWDIFVAEIERPGPVMQVTLGPEDDIHPSWSGDGTRLVYCAAPRAGQWELRIADLRTGARKHLGPGVYPDWNPEDGRIAFQFPKMRDEFLSGIWTVDEDGGKPTQIVTAEFFQERQWGAINPAWSPDGRWLAFATVRQSALAVWQDRVKQADDIWLVRADGSNVTLRMTDSAEPEWNPAWGGRGGGQMLYFTRAEEGRQRIWSVKPVLMTFPLESEAAGR